MVALLRQHHLHGLERALPIDREGHLDLEGLVRVDALRARAVLPPAEVPGAAPARPAAAVARRLAAVVLSGVQRRVPREHIGLLDVNLRAGLAAHIVRIAVVVRALRLVRVLSHRRQVKSGIASTASARDIQGVSHLLAQQLQCHVLIVVVDARRARVREVSTAAHLRPHLAAGPHLEGGHGRLRPARRHDGHRPVAWHLE
mmetsp:Transcript_65190/g.212376  ORF Transcript_65190/g.212376 Transcript_65190/m.212376 type:complete len:201 (+) Transcript_65190:936-1538(+)